MSNSPPQVAQSLVLLPERLDALLFALPAVGALAGTGRRLVAVTPEPLIPLAESLPEIAESSSDPGKLVGCEEAIVLSRSVKLADLWRLRRTGCRLRGYSGGLGGLLLSHAVPPAAKQVARVRHASEDFRELLEAMGVPPPESRVPRLEVSEDLRRAAGERLERGGIPSDASPLVALIPGGRLEAQRGERIAKESRWPWERFAEMARTLRQQVPGLRNVLVAGREPLWPAVRVHEETARFVPLIGPDLDAAGLAGLLGVCDLAVAADSELLHLAAAVGTPTVALFGPSDPRRRAPRGEGRSGREHRVIEAPGGDLRRLELEPVLEATRQILTPAS